MDKLDLLQTLLLCDRQTHSTIKRPAVESLINRPKQVLKRIIAFGGQTPISNIDPRVYEYDMDDNAWFELSDRIPDSQKSALPFHAAGYDISSYSSPGGYVFYNNNAVGRRFFAVLDARNDIQIQKQSEETNYYMARGYSTIVALSDNLVLSLGGHAIPNRQMPNMISNVIFNRSMGLCRPLYLSQDISLETACIALTPDTVLITGGSKLHSRHTFVSPTTECMFYHVSTNIIIPAAFMKIARRAHALCWLNDGRIFAYGGTTHDNLGHPEVYDIIEDTWTALPCTQFREDGVNYPHSWTFRANFTCAQLPNGKIFISGDAYRNFPLLYDLETGVLEKGPDTPTGETYGFITVPIYE